MIRSTTGEGEVRDTDNEEVNVVITIAEGDDNDSEDGDPSRPPTMIDDVELTDLVNEAVDGKKGSFKETYHLLALFIVSIEPEQRRRLEPSAPQNIKRQSRVFRQSSKTKKCFVEYFKL